MTSTDLGNQCFKTCSWIPLTMVKSLLLNSALLEIKIPAFNCSYTFSVLNKIRNPLTVWGIHLHLRIPLTLCGFHLQLRNPDQQAIFACCRIRKKTNVPTKFLLQVYVCGIHWNFVCGIHLHFGTYFKTCLWNPGTYRHKIGILSSAEFGLVMITNHKCVTVVFDP